MVALSADNPPNVDDWNFAEIERCDPQRVACLADAGTAAELVYALESTVRTAIVHGAARFGVDFDKDNPRVIIQFPVAQHIYDWFFNARTGYRAQYWAGAKQGYEFNRQLVVTLLRPLSETVRDEITARKIAIHITGASREEIDEGPIQLCRETIIRSLYPEITKIWICERFIQVDGKNPRPIPFSVLDGPPKLDIPRWAKHRETGNIGEGLRAPYPDQPECWLDLKGGFVGRDKVYQLKAPKKRAADLFKHGWT